MSVLNVKVFMELVFILVTNKIAGLGNVRGNFLYCFNSETDQLFSSKGQLSYRDNSTKSMSGETVNCLKKKTFHLCMGKKKACRLMSLYQQTSELQISP